MTDEKHYHFHTRETGNYVTGKKMYNVLDEKKVHNVTGVKLILM